MRGVEHPSKHLETYKCFAQADAYAGYNDACRTGRIKEIACMVNIRREFVKVHDSYKLPVYVLSRWAVRTICSCGLRPVIILRPLPTP